jgi:hypothetical protein
MKKGTILVPLPDSLLLPMIYYAEISFLLLISVTNWAHWDIHISFCSEVRDANSVWPSKSSQVVCSMQ